MVLELDPATAAQLHAFEVECSSDEDGGVNYQGGQPVLLVRVKFDWV